MEKYKCRFCFKSFINGRALGGHMRSHMLHLSSTLEEEERPSQLSEDDTESDASSSSEFDNPKMNLLLDDDNDDDDDDEESETESSRINNPTRKRSKRTRKLGSFDFEFKKMKTSQPGESVTELEHHSSASDTTTEENLAFCLIMLSRDKWKQHKTKKTIKKQTFEEEEEETEYECEDDYKSSNNIGRFKCETCGKEFKSYQALGGHRASHKKNKIFKTQYVSGVITDKKKIHQCPICFRVFSSGQALGGHKRSHGSQIVRIDKEEEEEGLVKQRMIDLNLPATNEEDNETSLVFDES